MYQTRLTRSSYDRSGEHPRLACWRARPRDRGLFLNCVAAMVSPPRTDTDDCYNVMTAQSASRLPESVGDRGDLRSPGRA
jgi:hypothetical protein